ncbi:MAG: uL15 family ribosomal protein [Candidatus Pacebacteria bacterium]|nr:uL15 family ribosomal protein [Candidatus Paceibacterota bacterium]
MQLHNLKREATHKTKKRVGRGGKRGKTSGRGTKGQKARSGHRMRPEARDIIKKIPKRRGYGKHRADSVNNSQVIPVVLNLSLVSKHFNDGDKVTPATLLEKGLIRKRRNAMPKVKILGGGAYTKKLTFEGVTISGQASKKLGL